MMNLPSYSDLPLRMRQLLSGCIQIILLTCQALFGLFVFVVLLLGFICGTQWGRELILTEGLQLSVAQTPFNIQLTGVQSTTIQEWKLEQLTLRHQNQELIKLEDLSIVFSWQALLDHTFSVNSLTVRHIWLTTNPALWPEIDKETSESSEPMSAWLNSWRFKVTNAAVNDVTVEHPALPENLFANISVQGLRIAQIASSTPNFNLDFFDLVLDRQTIDEHSLKNPPQWLRGSYKNKHLAGEVRLTHFPLDIFSVFLDDFNSGWLSSSLVIDGSLDSPHAKGSIETSTKLLGLSLEASANLEYVDKRVVFSHLEGHWDSLEVKGGQGTVELGDDIENNSLLDISVAQAAMPLTFVNNYTSGLPPELALNVIGAQVSIKGPISDIHYKGEVSAKGEFEKLPLMLTTNVTGNLAEFDFDTARIQSDSMLVEGQGTIQFAGQLKANGHFSGLNEKTLTKIAPKLDTEHLKALTFVSSGDFNLSGALDSPIYHATIAANGQYRQQALTLKSSVSGSREQIDIHNLKIWQASQKTSPVIVTNGNIDLLQSGLDLSITLNSLPLSFATLADVSIPEGLTGKLSVTSQLRGPWWSPSVATKGQIIGNYYKQDFKLNVTGRVAENKIEVSELALLSGIIKAHAKGQMQIDGPLEFEAQFSDLSDPFLLLIAPHLEPEVMKNLRFGASGVLTLTGTQKEPNLSGELNANGTFKAQPLYLTSRFTSLLSPLNIYKAQPQPIIDKFKLQQFELRLQPETQFANLTATGELENAKSILALDVGAQHIPIELISLIDISLPKELTGKLSFNANTSGSLNKPAINLNGKLQGYFKNEPYQLMLDGRIADEALEIHQSSFSLNGKALAFLEGKVDTLNQSLSLAIDDLDLSHMALFGWEQATGKLQTTLQFTSDQHKSALKGQVNYRADWEWLNEQAEMQTSPVHFNALLNSTANTADIDSRIYFENMETSQLQINLSLAPYKRWLETLLKEKGKPAALPTQFDLKGSFDLKALQSIIQNDLESFGGMIDLNLQTTGTTKMPELIGEFNLRDGYYKNELSGTDLSGIELRTQLLGQSAQINLGEVITPGNGQISLKGDMSWAGEKDAAIKILAKNAVILERPEIEAAVSGEMLLSGNQQGYLLDGHLTLQPLVLKINSSFGSVPELQVQVLDKNDKTTISQRMAKKSSQFPLTVDLEVLTGQHAVIQGRGLMTGLEGSVKIVGPVNKLNYSGKLQTVRGYMQLFNKRFELVNGTAAFDAANVILNIQAENIGRNITYKINVTGTLDDINIVLSTDPALPQDEALARLLFGKSVKNMSPIQAVRLFSALQTLQGGNSLLPDPIEYARKLMSVDDLNIESTETTNGTGIKVGIGKYLSESAYIELEKTPDPNKPWQGRLDIELTPSLHLETTTSGSAGDSGVGFSWIKDY